MNDPIENPPNKLYDPRRYDVGHWNDKEVYVYREVVDNPEGSFIDYEDLVELLDGYYSPGAPWITSKAVLTVERNNNGNAFLVVHNRDSFSEGKDSVLFVTPDLNAIRYLISIPSMVPTIGEDSDSYEDKTEYEE